MTLQKSEEEQNPSADLPHAFAKGRVLLQTFIYDRDLHGGVVGVEMGIDA